MILNLRHTGIVVGDLEAALHFYGELLGFKVTKRMDESGAYIDNMLGLQGVQVTTVKMAAPDGNLIEILYYQSHPRKARDQREICEIGVSHVALTVDDLELEYRRLSDAGVQFYAPPQLSPDDYAKVTFCRDPDGNPVELVQVLRSA
jgi:catechol 2,3-dioxygenase-like lactoylglutathione lyase family enzyme